jgi:uncharacterized protein
MNEPVMSPCTNVCRLDPRTGWCEGCLRTIDEIAAWSAMSDEDKRAVLAELPERRGQTTQRGLRYLSPNGNGARKP